MALPAYRVAQTLSGNSAFTQEMTTTASTGSAVAGQFVVMAADGTVSDAGDGADNLTGLALETVGAGASVRVVWGTPDVIFSAAISGTWNDNMQGAFWDYLDAGVNLAASTDDVFHVHGLDPTDDDRALVSVRNAEAMGIPGSPTVV